MSAQARRLVSQRYQLLGRLGEGGMGTVYRARDERLSRDVAVKLVPERFGQDAQFVERFFREAKLCAGLAHPGVLNVFDAGAEPWPFIVMELVQGLDAGVLVRRGTRLTAEQAGRIVAQVSQALAFVHARGVLHRDVSPGNILLRRSDGAAKLADFGLASPADEVSETRLEDLAGTPGYMAPEVLSGAPATAQSDLYSLGVATYRLLAPARRARQERTGATTGLASAAPPLSPLAELRPDVPRALTSAIEQATALEPAARQRSVAEFRAQLLRAVDRRHRAAVGRPRLSRRPRRSAGHARLMDVAPEARDVRRLRSLRG
jgi:serine/threonine-protein kinase